MPNAVQLTKDNQVVYPVTHASLIVGMENQGRMDAVYAWDGTDTPVVANIPAGVVVTYNGTDYTGTLVASAETSGRFYLVPSDTVQGEYDRYMTDAYGGSFTWKPAGTTAIPSPDVVASLDSDDDDKALAASQGKVLDGKVTGLQE